MKSGLVTVDSRHFQLLQYCGFAVSDDCGCAIPPVHRSAKGTHPLHLSGRQPGILQATDVLQTHRNASRVISQSRRRSVSWRVFEVKSFSCTLTDERRYRRWKAFFCVCARSRSNCLMRSVIFEDRVRPVLRRRNFGMAELHLGALMLHSPAESILPCIRINPLILGGPISKIGIRQFHRESPFQVSVVNVK